MKREILTQKKDAEVLGVSQPRISDIATGKISKFTIEELQKILHNCVANIDVDEEADRGIEEYFASIPVKTKVIFKNNKVEDGTNVQ